MHLEPALDMSWGPALAMLGIFAFPFVVIWTLISEAITLRLLRYHHSFWHCFGEVTLANLISGAVGIGWQIFMFNMTAYFYWVNGLIGSPPIDDYQTIATQTITVGIFLLLLAGWIGSILIEGLVLMGRRSWRGDFAKTRELEPQRPNWRAFLGQTWVASLIINTVSYAGLVVALVIF
jgi:hypothetical protein